MGKPLLTDEIIEKARRGESIEDTFFDEQETKILFAEGSSEQDDFSIDETLHIHVEPTVIKSRRIENEKRSVFQSKLNKILFVIVLLLLLLIAAIIWF